jgi:uncharacterized protein YuzE
MAVKPVRISPHALFQMRRRGILRADVTRMIRSPGQVLPSRKERQIFQNFIGRARQVLLRVVVKENASAVSCGDRLQDEPGRQVLENAVKVINDKEKNTLSILLRSGKVAESDETHPGLILDYDKAGRLVSLELLDALEQVQAPQSVEFALAAAE